jgi:hypothetical protein
VLQGNDQGSKSRALYVACQRLVIVRGTATFGVHNKVGKTGQLRNEPRMVWSLKVYQV